MIENVYLVYEWYETSLDFEIEGVYANREDAEKTVKRINSKINSKINNPEEYAFIIVRIVRYTSE